MWRSGGIKRCAPRLKTSSDIPIWDVSSWTSHPKAFALIPDLKDKHPIGLYGFRAAFRDTGGNRIALHSRRA
jgi:hypothetical protein